MNEHDPEYAAFLRLALRRRFHAHLIVFVTVMVALMVLWVLLWAGIGVAFPWFVLLGVGWALALVIEWWEAYSPPSIDTRDIRREIAAERRLRRTRAARERARAAEADEARAASRQDDSHEPRPVIDADDASAPGDVR